MFRKPIVYFFVCISLGLWSCTKAQPEACISVQQRVTTFLVVEQVQFQASCSKNAASYNWSIGKPGNYLSFNAPTIQHKFDEAGSYEVKLRVGNSEQSDVVSMVVEVIAPQNGE